MEWLSNGQICPGTLQRGQLTDQASAFPHSNPGATGGINRPTHTTR